MTTQEIDIGFLDKKEKKTLLGFLSKLKTVYKGGVYLINRRFVIPDDESERELSGRYTIYLSDKVYSMIEKVELPTMCYIPTVKDLTNMITSFKISTLNDVEEEDVTKLFVSYMMEFDNFDKLMCNRYELCDMFNNQDWIDELYDEKKTVEVDISGLKFYMTARLLPYTTAKSCANVLYAYDINDSELGTLAFWIPNDLFDLRILLKFIKLE